MMKVATLVAESISYDSIGNAVSVETETIIPINSRSVTRVEWSEAGRLGLNAQHCIITRCANYHGEKICILGGERYGIYRTYTKGDYIELYLEKKGGI